MAQRPPQRHQPNRRPPPLPEDDYNLRDPAEGQPPALLEGTEVALTGDAQQDAASLFPQFIPPPCYTIADEQRDRSAEIEEVGLVTWIDQHDSRTEEEKADAQLQVAGVRGDNVNVVKTGGGRFPAYEDRAR